MSFVAGKPATRPVLTQEVDAVVRKLESFGTVFIEQGDGMGAGVRLKFMREDVRQIGRFETEGGVVGDDDLP